MKKIEINKRHVGLKIAAAATISKLMEQVKSIQAVVVSTEDGFEVAAYAQNKAQTKRLAAMASSLSALCDVAGDESQLGLSDNVTISAAEGHIIMLKVPRDDLPLTLSVVARKDAVLGQALYFARAAADELKAFSASQ